MTKSNLLYVAKQSRSNAKMSNNPFSGENQDVFTTNVLPHMESEGSHAVQCDASFHLNTNPSSSELLSYSLKIIENIASISKYQNWSS